MVKVETVGEEGTSGNVVAFRAGNRRLLPHEEFTRIGPVEKASRCKHAAKMIDEELRRVSCRGCGEVLDPIQVLIEHVQNWRMYHGPLLEEMRLHRERRRREDESFEEWWLREGGDRSGKRFATKKLAAREAWRAATTQPTENGT